MDFLYKKSEEDEINIINYIHNVNNSYWQKQNESEHDIIEQLTNNPNLHHENNLLFYHWYERRYKRNIINRDILKSINEAINVTKKELHDEVRDRMLEFMASSRFLGYTIYFEYYYDFFPEIEKFNFNEFVGKEFIFYILDLFPKCIEIDYCSEKRFFRFSGKEMREVEENGQLVLYFNDDQLPSFYPRILNNLEYHTYTPHKYLQKTRKEIENIIREEKSIPKIGEGWISETLLFYEIKEAFQEHQVIPHGSPSWLGLQHLDIFFPELNIAIEYQGKQHNEPVKFFGGQEAFIKNQERDQRKKNLCEKNGVKLLFVFPETDTFKFLKELKIIIENI